MNLQNNQIVKSDIFEALKSREFDLAYLTHRMDQVMKRYLQAEYATHHIIIYGQLLFAMIAQNCSEKLIEEKIPEMLLLLLCLKNLEKMMMVTLLL